MTRFRIVIVYQDNVYPHRVTRYVMAETREDAIKSLRLTPEELKLIESIEPEGGKS